MTVRGAVHIHTTYSADGKVALPDFCRMARERDLRFLLMSEHAENITEKEYKGFVEACEQESDEDLLVIPGLEFMYDDYVHILGLGLSEHPGLHEMKGQIDRIHSLGGVAVLAHANTCQKVPYEELEDVDAVEAWNSRYWGRFAPDPKGLSILKKLRKRLNKPVPCLGGLDFHGIHHFRGLVIEVNADELTGEAVLSAIRKGDYTLSNGRFRLGAFEYPGPARMAVYSIIYYVYFFLRKLGSLRP